MKKRNFKIGDFCFSIIYPETIPLPQNLLKFETKHTQTAYTYHLELSTQFPSSKGTLIVSRPDLLVYQTDLGEIRYIGIRGRHDFYGYYEEVSSREALVLISPNDIHLLPSDPVFNSLLALERHLISYDSFVLHCAYMNYKGKAILFSAPSETGKTTQANLWAQYRGAVTINGDRGLLQKVNNTWMVKGWPVCGSSDICTNEETPIYAIVMLSQGKINTVKQLNPALAFMQVYSQVTINRWNEDTTKQAISLIESLVCDIPVYHLSCTISEEAVCCLEHALFKHSTT